MFLCGVVFYFSSQDGLESAGLSNIFVEFLKMHISFPPFSFVLDFLSIIVRKFAHFSIYFLLGISSVSLLKEYFVFWKNILIYALFFCLFYAVTDEVHQLFVVGRSGKILDVFIDFCGSSCAIFFSFLLSHFRKKKTF